MSLKTGRGEEGGKFEKFTESKTGIESKRREGIRERYFIIYNCRQLIHLFRSDWASSV